MSRLVATFAVVCIVWAGPALAGEACPDKPDALGVSRIIEVDAANGPKIGTLNYKKTLDLAPMEVVLTFDDGPHKNTLSILNSLDDHCAKATFFPVGIWAKHSPKIMREVAARGHTIGVHSWSHPRSVPGQGYARAVQQIEKGFTALKEVLGTEAAPFFRWPGLRDSKKLNAYLAKRNTAVMSCDLGSDDWRGIGAKAIVSRTFRNLKAAGNRGIIIFHDTKSTTAAALPVFLKEMKKRGFKLVHMVPKPKERVQTAQQAMEKTASGR